MVKVCIVVSHNARIQCVLDTIKANIGETKRFKNCAIMKLVLEKDKLTLSMIHSGDVTAKEETKLDRKYYATATDASKSSKYIPYIDVIKNGSEYSTILKKLKIKVEDIHDVLIFYIVRHGQSEHNDSSYWTSKLHYKLDTSLVSSGETAAKSAGVKLNQELELNQYAISRFFVSDLSRTYQTLLLLLRQFTIRFGMQGSLRPTVLPCTSEVIDAGRDGNCDAAAASSSMLSKMARENYPKCTTATIQNQSEGCNGMNWDLYLQFYANKMRGQDDTIYGTVSGNRTFTASHKQSCRNTSMLAMAIFHLFYFETTLYGNVSLDQYINKNKVGGKKKTRRTRRSI